MKAFGLFGKKNKNTTMKNDETGLFTPSTANSLLDSSDKKTASGPYEYNSALFQQFYHDLENNTLPEIPDPTQTEIMNYTQKRRELLTRKNSLSNSIDVNLLLENNAIPVEVEIWVEKVFCHYFDRLTPVLGLVHWCERARKALYKYKGYTWHTISELHPNVLFD